MSSQRECVYFSITVVDVQQLRYSESNISITVSPKVACSAGVFWVGKTLFVFIIIFDFMTVEDWGE